MFCKLSTIALVSFFAVGQAKALDFTQPVKAFDGKSFVDGNGKEINLTLAEVVEGSLLNAPATSRELKDKNFFLSLDIHSHITDFVPTPEQIERIRDALAATQNTAMYGQTMLLIDPTFHTKK